MADIVAVLVVPAEGDPGGLLAEGPCYAWPPRVGRANEWTPMTWDEQGAYDEEALPLGWDGELVPEGWDRARRVAREVPDDYLGGEAWFAAQDAHPDFDAVKSLAAALMAAGLASRVVRLARVDGRLVEVSDG